MTPSRIIRPHPGPQTAFLGCDADIAGFGGSAGGGKTCMELWDMGRWAATVPGFFGVIFRKTYPEIMNPGALWDESMQWLPLMGGVPVRSESKWTFPKTGSYIKFSHLQYDQDVHNWQGSQPAAVAFDEVTHFSAYAVMYMLSRLRSKCGVRPYMRMTCNPDPTSWVADFFAWWIDQETGLAIPERSGVHRYMARLNGQLIWSHDREELEIQGLEPLSVTFIRSSVTDNPSLDADYISKLKALTVVERARLLDGNWKIKAIAGSFFKRQWFSFLPARPVNVRRWVRYWDRAATEPSPTNTDPDWTAGVLLGIAEQGRTIVADVARIRATPGATKEFIKATAHADGRDVEVVLEVDPGQAGLVDVAQLTVELQGFPIHRVRPTKAKAERAKPVSSQAEAGNLALVDGKWVRDFLTEAEGFLDERETKAPTGYHDDMIDALSGAYNFIACDPVPRIRTI